MTILDCRILKDGDKFKTVVGYNNVYGDNWKNPMQIGSTVEIEGHDFKVIGVLDRIGNPIDDGIIYMTKEILKEILDVEDEESQILVKTASGFDPEDVAEKVEDEAAKKKLDAIIKGLEKGLEEGTRPEIMKEAISILSL